jgi:hypothetical protein
MYIKTIPLPKKEDDQIEIRVGENIKIQLRRKRDGAAIMKLTVDAPREMGIFFSHEGVSLTSES